MQSLRHLSRVSTSSFSTYSPHLPCLSACFSTASSTNETADLLKAFRTAAGPKGPSRSEILGTYRALNRTLYFLFFHASQYATYSELSDISLSPQPPVEQRKQFLTSSEFEKNRLHVQEKIGNWKDLLRSTYEERRTEKDTNVIRAQQQEAVDTLAMLRSNMEYARYLLEGGWGVRRDSAANVINTARRVGLEVPNAPPRSSSDSSNKLPPVPKFDPKAPAPFEVEDLMWSPPQGAQKKTLDQLQRDIFQKAAMDGLSLKDIEQQTQDSKDKKQ